MTASKKTAIAFLISALVFLLAVGLLSTQAVSGFTASVRNTTNTVGTGTSFYTAANGTTTHCSSIPAGNTVPNISTFSCTGALIPNVPATGNATQSETLTASGTAAFSSAQLTANSCGAVQFANTATANNPMLARGSLSFKQTGPFTDTSSAQFNGTDTSAVDITSYAGLQTYSVGIWFNTTTAGGALLGWSTSPANTAPSQYDRMLYFTSAGKLAYSTYSGGARTVTSANAYNDGKWHYAVATATSGNPNSTLTLYVDGVQTSTLTFAATASSEASTGYWRVGQAKSTTGDGYTGTGQWFTGKLANFHVETAALTQTNVTALNAATTQTGFTSTLSSIGNLKEYWPLNDTGATTYTGTLPVIGTTNPCSAVRVTIGTQTTCVYPAAASTCPTPSATYTLATLVNSGPQTLPTLSPGANQTLTITLTRDTTYNANYETGLRLNVPITITQNGFTQNFVWTNNTTII